MEEALGDGDQGREEPGRGTEAFVVAASLVLSRCTFCTVVSHAADQLCSVTVRPPTNYPVAVPLPMVPLAPPRRCRSAAAGHGQHTYLQHRAVAHRPHRPPHIRDGAAQAGRLTHGGDVGCGRWGWRRHAGRPPDDGGHDGVRLGQSARTAAPHPTPASPRRRRRERPRGLPQLTVRGHHATPGHDSVWHPQVALPCGAVLSVVR